MNCPWCSFGDVPRRLHAHLAEEHPEGVRFEEQRARQRYAISCPYCHLGYEQTIKPGLDDPGFLEEYRNEVRLVAFDMLVNHLIGEHEQASTET
ncbi:MAG: hypothetical protein ACYDGN_02430 [Acidimicrobiales bacterium]